MFQFLFTEFFKHLLTIKHKCILTENNTLTTFLLYSIKHECVYTARIKRRILLRGLFCNYTFLIFRYCFCHIPPCCFGKFGLSKSSAMVIGSKAGIIRSLCNVYSLFHASVNSQIQPFYIKSWEYHIEKAIFIKVSFALHLSEKKARF